MATYRDPARVFAPLEILERLLEIRADAGYQPVIFLRSADDLVAYFDAYDEGAAAVTECLLARPRQARASL